jgi:hypothetical protein
MSKPRTTLPPFDELKAMAAERPEELEDLRLKMTEEILNNAPEGRRRRLQGLVFSIDMVRRRAKNPMQACIKLSQMMMDSTLELRDALSRQRLPEPCALPQRAEVIPLRRSRG